MGALTYLAYFFAFVWLLAVYKVFILDDGREFQEKMKQRAIDLEARREAMKLVVNSDPHNTLQTISEDAPKKTMVFKVGGAVKQPKPDKPAVISPNTILQWPPVLQDGSLSVADGFDEMPLIDLKVPKFWSPPEGTDLNTVGKKVNGEETIFLMIASFRDFQCKETIGMHTLAILNT